MHRSVLVKRKNGSGLLTSKWKAFGSCYKLEKRSFLIVVEIQEDVNEIFIGLTIVKDESYVIYIMNSPDSSITI